MLVDLHIHTTASDGTDSPEKVVLRAKAMGLKAIAITDHDTVEGVEPALEVGRLHEIEVIAGVELGAEYLGKEIHILGYLIEIDNCKLKDKLKVLLDERKNRIRKMIRKLQDLGISIKFEKASAISGAGSIGRPHLAAALVEEGVVKTIAEAFEKYIGTGCPAYVPRYKLSPLEAISLIRAAGGVPVLAHPGQNNSGQHIKIFKAAGLAGLEVYHPAHSREQECYYHRLAGEYELIVTGGSDYHGPRYKAGNRLGSVTVPYSVVNEIKKRICYTGGKYEKGQVDGQPVFRHF